MKPGMSGRAGIKYDLCDNSLLIEVFLSTMEGGIVTMKGVWSHQIIKPALLLTSFMLIATVVAACTTTETATPAEVATKYVACINSKDIDALASISATPLWVRQQAWKSAKNGTGFVLGKAKDVNLTDQAQINKYFSDPAKIVAVERELPNDASLLLLQDELKGSEKLWSRLSMHIFRRDMGNVEHIFVVGVNDRGKVAAVYIN